MRAFSHPCLPYLARRSDEAQRDGGTQVARSVSPDRQVLAILAKEWPERTARRLGATGTKSRCFASIWLSGQIRHTSFWETANSDTCHTLRISVPPCSGRWKRRKGRGCVGRLTEARSCIYSDTDRRRE